MSIIIITINRSELMWHPIDAVVWRKLLSLSSLSVSNVVAKCITCGLWWLKSIRWDWELHCLPCTLHSFGFSSDLSGQSGSPSQTKLMWIQEPSAQRNWRFEHCTEFVLDNFPAKKNTKHDERFFGKWNGINWIFDEIGSVFIMLLIRMSSLIDVNYIVRYYVSQTVLFYLELFSLSLLSLSSLPSPSFTPNVPFVMIS